MIQHNIGKQLLDALFNINLYSEDDKKDKLKDPDTGYPLDPYLVTKETSVSEQVEYKGIILQSFNLTKDNTDYFEYNEFEYVYTTDKGYLASEKRFTLIEVNPNRIDFGYNHYLGLFTQMPTYTGTIVDCYEPTAEDYHRVNLHKSVITDQMTIDTAIIDNEGGASVTNKEVIVFPESYADTNGWGKIVGFGVFKERTGGEPIFWGRLKTPVIVGKAQVPLFRVGDFKVTLK